MLTTLTRKLCPLMTLALATVGCGKKIAEKNETELARHTENQELPSVYVLRLDGSESSSKDYSIPKSARFEVPDRLKVRSGNTYNKVVEIAYDVNKYDSEDFQFKCSYVASANQSEMVLSHCIDYDGDDFGDISGQEFTLRKNDIIQLRFRGANASDMVVEAIYSMDWI